MALILFVVPVLAVLASVGRSPAPTPRHALSAAPFPALPCVPALTWTWEGDVEAPTLPSPIGAGPVAVQLTDDNADGRIDASDHADLVLAHALIGGFVPREGATITALDGSSGRQLFTIPDIAGHRGTLATGDLDGDTVAEIVAAAAGGLQLVAFDATGRLAWRSEPLPEPVEGLDAIGLADLDQDGSPEITVGRNVLRADGSLAWTGAGGSGGTPGWLRASVAVDLRADLPGLELLAGHTLYDSTGGIAWTRTDLPDAPTAIGDLDGDGAAEIVLAGNDHSPPGRGSINVLDVLGRSIVPPVAALTELQSAQPLVADVDADGRDEVFIREAGGVRLLALDGGRLADRWTAPGQDNSCCAAASAFDFDGDGAAEILHGDELSWRAFDGRTGRVLWEVLAPSSTDGELPLVVELDSDPAPEIVVARAGGAPWGIPAGLDVYDCDGACAARGTWNQATYHVTNVNDDGTIPAVEPGPASTPGWPAQRSRCPCVRCEDVTATVEAALIDREGVRRALLAKARAACRALDRGRDGTAGNVLCAIIHEVDAQDGKHVTTTSAAEIRACVRKVARVLGLPLTPCAGG